MLEDGAVTLVPTIRTAELLLRDWRADDRAPLAVAGS
jgi:hypothetical protein